MIKLILILFSFILLSCSKEAEESGLVFSNTNNEEVTLKFNSLDSVNSTNFENYSLTGECIGDLGKLAIKVMDTDVESELECVDNNFSYNLDLTDFMDSNSLLITVTESEKQIEINLLKDTVLPEVIAIAINPGSYALSEEVNIQVTFSEPINITGQPRIELILDSQSENNLYAIYQSGTGTNEIQFRYIVKSGDGDATGIKLLGDIVQTELNTIKDGVGNLLSSSLIQTDFDNVYVDSDAPLITSFIEPANGTYANNGGELLFQVNFSEAVNIGGVPRILVNLGDNQVYATYKSGSGTSGLEFSYLVQDGDNDSDGITISEKSIDLNGGSILGLDGNISALGFSLYYDPMSEVIINTNSGIIAPEKVIGVTTAPTTSNTSLSVTWMVPNNNGTNIINYSIQYRVAGTSTWNNITTSSTTNQKTITNLSTGVSYEVRVAGNNGLLGPYSNITTADIFDILSLNPIAWLSSTNITNGGIEPIDGEKVANWKDLTGAAGDAVGSNIASQPTYKKNVFNGLPAVRFDGYAKGLSGTFNRSNNGGLTVFLVGKMDTNNSRECFFEFFSTTATRRGFFFNYGMNEASINHQLDDTSFNLWNAYDDGTKTDFYENGQTIYTDRLNWGNGSSTAFTGNGAYILGDDQTGGDELHGYLGEFLIFDRELTVEEVTSIRTYLKNKWGTP